MDVIRAIESYPYYHSMTGRSREEWNAWRVRACEEWKLNKEILEKEGGNNGMCESESDYSGDDGVLHVSPGDRGQGRGEREHRLPDAARVPGEDGPIREGVSGTWHIPGECH